MKLTRQIRLSLYILAVSILSVSTAYSQNTTPKDSVDIKGDTLQGTTVTFRQKANYIPKGQTLRTEVISTAGLHKMACCNLAESFENSSSVTVGYSDATTGARQIRLLGLNGIYTQMLDEKRPIMRLFSAPWGLTFIPGSWMESIQIAKGSTSVIDGIESMTGQINIEHKRPTDEKPLFINGSIMTDSKSDLNVVSSIQLDERFSTVILAHADTKFKVHDSDHDGFIDEPKSHQYSLTNRWLYYTPKTKIQWGARGIFDKREGGMKGYDKKSYNSLNQDPWGTDIFNNNFNAYLKVGQFLDDSYLKSIALIADYTHHKMHGYFGSTSYFGQSNSGYINLMFRDEVSPSHDFTVGVSGNLDGIKQDYLRALKYNDIEDVRLFNSSILNYSEAVYAEYTYKKDDIFSAIVGVRGELFHKDKIEHKDKFEFIPRLTLKYKPSEYVVIRANGGRGIRYALPISDNIGVLSTGKPIIGEIDKLHKEDSYTYGGNVTFYLPVDKKESTYISLDFFRTAFKKQLVVDYDVESNKIYFYNKVGKSYTNNYQIDFNTEPFDRFSVAATFRYSDSKMAVKRSSGTSVIEKPMMSRFKGVLNLQYKTNMNKWVFDFTATLNGPAKVYDFMRSIAKEDGTLLYPKGKTPTYPMLYAQITRHFKGFDLYIGCENITNYTQKNAIIGAKDSHGMIIANNSNFDASCIWGPLMGRKFDIGFRMTIWKRR